MMFLAPIFLVIGFSIPMEAEITYYCPDSCCCGVYADGLTSSGTVPKEGRTIAAGQQFPFGTEVEINGTVYTVEDRGGAIKGNKIDIFVSDHQTALQNGRHSETVYIKIAP
jgi:3D (Asp-Asp-Asp) domain-containing protein